MRARLTVGLSTNASTATAAGASLENCLIIFQSPFLIELSTIHVRPSIAQTSEINELMVVIVDLPKRMLN
jgi:hypothetical protein